MRLLSALALAALLAGCTPDPPPPPPVAIPAAPDTAGSGAPTADEIDAGAGILGDALKGASGR